MPNTFNNTLTLIKWLISTNLIFHMHNHLTTFLQNQILQQGDRATSKNPKSRKWS